MQQLTDRSATPEQAQQALAARRQAYDSLEGFAELMDIPGVPAPDLTEEQLENLDESRWDIIETPLAKHHRLILQTTQDLLEDRLVHNGQVVRRLMLMFPPGSAKSTYATVVTPAWLMARNPGLEVILCGYGDTIVKRHGKRCRQLCASAQFANTFGTTLDPETKAANEWALTNGASYKAAGILSGVTGFRCQLLVWDDMLKGREDADSQTIRDKVWAAYIDDARSRKTPRTHEIGIGTRWHEDDHMGRILPEGYEGESGFIEGRDGNVWLVLCVAAECEREDDPLERTKGDMLWPEWFDEDYWRDKRVNPRSWGSLYQQRPAPEEGIYFQRPWIKRYTDLPVSLNKYISFDPAVTSAEHNAGADETAIQVWGIDHHARVFLLDEWVDRVTMDVWIGQLLTMVQIHKPEVVISESGVIRRAAEPFIRREMQQRGIFALFEWVTRTADKEAMARSYQAMVAAGQILFPTTSVGDKTVDELLRFPTAKSDHRVDAGANLCLYLEQLWEAQPPQAPPEESATLTHELKVSAFMPERFPRKKSKYALR